MLVTKFPREIVWASFSKAFFRHGVFVLLRYFFTFSATEIAYEYTSKQLRPDLTDPGNGNNN